MWLVRYCQVKPQGPIKVEKPALRVQLPSKRKLTDGRVSIESRGWEIDCGSWQLDFMRRAAGDLGAAGGGSHNGSGELLSTTPRSTLRIVRNWQPSLVILLVHFFIHRAFNLNRC